MNSMLRARARVIEWCRHREFLLLLLLLFVSFRLLAILLFRPGGFIADFSDYDFYYALGQLAPKGYRPNLNLVTAYPPLFPPLAVAVFELSSRIPPWADPRLFFHVLLGCVLLAFETGNLLVIAHLAQALTDPSGTAGASVLDLEQLRPAVLYALLFVPVYTMLGWFETMPLFFLLLGLDLLLARRGQPWGWLGSAISAGLGFLTKLIPVVLLPAAMSWLGVRFEGLLRLRGSPGIWQGGSWRRAVPYVAVFVVTVVGVGYLLTQANPRLAFSSLQLMNNRPPWESLWALLDGYYGYGVLPLDARDTGGLERSLWTSRLPWPLIIAVAGVIYLWLLTRPYDWRRPHTVVAFTGVGVIFMMLLNWGWSPQFLVWVLAFIVLLLPGLRGISLAILLSFVNFVEASVYLILLPQERWLLWVTVLLRMELLLALLLSFLGQIWPGAARLHLGRAGRGMAWAGVAMAVCATVVGAPRLVHAYSERRLAEQPCREAIAYLEEQVDGLAQTIATAQFEAWQSLYPWLHRDYKFVVFDDYAGQGNDPALAAEARLLALAQQGEFWWAEMAGNGAPEDNQRSAFTWRFFARPDVQCIELRELGRCRLSRIVTLPPAPIAVAAVAGGPIQLQRAEIDTPRPGSDLHLVLYWQSQAPVTASYTVFTHLVDAANQMVAQQDNLPGGGYAPTDTWPPGVIIRDPYRLALSADLPPGDYRLLVGLYRDSTRSMLTLADGRQTDAVDFTLRIGRP